MNELPTLPPFPTSRPRRLRRTAALRRLTSQVSLRPSDLVLPMFVAEGLSEPRAISSMPGVMQHSLDSLAKAAVDAVRVGVGGLMLFGIPEFKDAQGSGADSPSGILNVALARLKFELGDDLVRDPIFGIAGRTSGLPGRTDGQAQSYQYRFGDDQAAGAQYPLEQAQGAAIDTT